MYTPNGDLVNRHDNLFKTMISLNRDRQYLRPAHIISTMSCVGNFLTVLIATIPCGVFSH